MRKRVLLALVLLGTLLLSTSCNGGGEANLTLAEDRPNLIFFHAEF